MKTKLIIILVLIHTTFELANSQQIDCLKLQSYTDSVLLNSNRNMKEYMARNLFDDPYSVWRLGEIITKKNDTLVGSIKLKKQSRYTRLPRHVKIEDSIGKQKSYSAKKISKFNRGEKKYVALEFNGYHYFIQQVFTDKLVIYHGIYFEPDFKYTAISSLITLGHVNVYTILPINVFYIKVGNKILGPTTLHNLGSFIKYTCVCDLKYEKSDLHIYDIYLILVYLNSQYYY